eukprot:scaffold81887_cov43-Prasinocladus_malaysianus.AAC.1
MRGGSSTVQACLTALAGEMLEPKTFAGGDGSLRRPSGFCFDNNNDMLVTSLDGCIHRFAGPCGPSPGQHLQVFACLDGMDAPNVHHFALGRPWALKCVRDCVLVLVHSGKEETETATNYYYPTERSWQGVVMLSADGSRVLKTSSSEKLMFMPHTLAIE